jgi:hypothetical protein
MAAAFSLLSSATSTQVCGHSSQRYTLPFVRLLVNKKTREIASESFPTRFRYSGSGIAYSLSAILGGMIAPVLTGFIVVCSFRIAGHSSEPHLNLVGYLRC